MLRVKQCCSTGGVTGATSALAIVDWCNLQRNFIRLRAGWERGGGSGQAGEESSHPPSLHSQLFSLTEPQTEIGTGDFSFSLLRPFIKYFIEKSVLFNLWRCQRCYCERAETYRCTSSDHQVKLSSPSLPPTYFPSDQPRPLLCYMECLAVSLSSLRNNVAPALQHFKNWVIFRRWSRKVIAMHDPELSFSKHSTLGRTKHKTKQI